MVLEIDRRDLRDYRVLFVMGMAVGFILILDQAYLFGIPFGGFLGDLSGYDPTQNPELRHWMVGLVLFVTCAMLYSLARRRD